MDSFELFLKYLTPLMGVIVGALMNQSFTNRKNKDQSKEAKFFAIYEHFYSDEMIVTRREADKHLLDNQDKSFEYCIGYESGNGALSFSRVLHAFQRLSVACAAGQIDSDLAKSYMEGQLKYWYETHLLRFEKVMKERGEFVHIIKLANRWGIA